MSNNNKSIGRLFSSMFSRKPTQYEVSNLQVDSDALKMQSSGAAARDVKVLGTGCAKCKSTYSVIERVIASSGKDIRLTKVEDIVDIMSYNVMSTPAIVVDGEVRLKGRVPSESEVRSMLGL